MYGRLQLTIYISLGEEYIDRKISLIILQINSLYIYISLTLLQNSLKILECLGPTKIAPEPRGFVLNFVFPTSAPARPRAPDRDINKICAHKLDYFLSPRVELSQTSRIIFYQCPYVTSREYFCWGLMYSAQLAGDRPTGRRPGQNYHFRISVFKGLGSSLKWSCGLHNTMDHQN